MGDAQKAMFRPTQDTFSELMTMFSAEETLISASMVHHRRGGLVEGGRGAAGGYCEEYTPPKCKTCEPVWLSGKALSW